MDPNKLPHIHRDMIPHFLRRYLAPEFFTHTLNACNSLNHFALSCPRTTHELVCGNFVIPNLVRSGIALRLQSLILNTIGRLKDHTDTFRRGYGSNPTLTTSLAEIFPSFKDLTLSTDNIWYPGFGQAYMIRSRDTPAHGPGRLFDLLPRSLKRLTITEIHAIPLADLEYLAIQCGPDGLIPQLKSVQLVPARIGGQV